MSGLRALRFLVAAAALILVIPALARAQANPDFSGTWMFDDAKSDPPPAGRGGGGGGRGGGGFGGGGRGGRGGLGGPATELVIKQTATDLSVESKLPQGAQTAVYKLDGSETLISGPAGDTKAKAMWEAGRLVVTSTASFSGPQGDVTITTRDVHSVNGAVLTIERTQETPFGSNTRKLVYNKG